MPNGSPSDIYFWHNVGRIEQSALLPRPTSNAIPLPEFAALGSAYDALNLQSKYRELSRLAIATVTKRTETGAIAQTAYRLRQKIVHGVGCRFSLFDSYDFRDSQRRLAAFATVEALMKVPLVW